MTNFFFGPQQAQQLIDTMRVIHGNLFTHQMGNVSPEQVETIITGAMVGVSEAQFHFGLAQLSTQAYCPSIAQFRALCVSGSWWSVDEAWARACRFTADKSVQITQITKVALDEVIQLIYEGHMRTAREQFSNTYNAFVAKAQQVGRTQEMYVPPKQLEHKKKSHVPVSNDEAVQRLNALKQKLNINNRSIQQPQKLEPKQNLASPAVQEPWPDPFDQPDEYLEACERDGLNVPKTVIKHIGGTA